MDDLLKIAVAIIAAIIYFLFSSRQKPVDKSRPGTMVPPLTAKKIQQQQQQQKKVEKTTFGQVLKEYEANLKPKPIEKGRGAAKVREVEEQKRKDSVLDMKRTADVIKRDVLRKQPTSKIIKEDVKKDQGKILKRRDDGRLIDNKDEKLIDVKTDEKLIHSDEEIEVTLRRKTPRAFIEDPREEGGKRKRGENETYSEFYGDKNTVHPIAEMLRNQDTMKHAVILAEILRKKW